MVALFVSAWIEITATGSALDRLGVALFVSAWIEIVKKASAIFYA